jgi:hypothetical protein
MAKKVDPSPEPEYSPELARAYWEAIKSGEYDLSSDLYWKRSSRLYRLRSALSSRHLVTDMAWFFVGFYLVLILAISLLSVFA